jgi:hypothetical protein
MPDTMRPSSASSEFAELVYADPNWVRAEFDGIVAANFDPSPPHQCRPPRPDSTGPTAPARAAALVTTYAGASGVVLPINRWRRQRSPPTQSGFRMGKQS